MPRSRHSRRGGSGFFWFVTGAVVGAFGVGLAWTLHDQPSPPTAPTAPTAPSSSPPQAQAEPAAKPHFVFHQLLPEMEVLVPEAELKDAASSPPRPGRQPEASRPATPEPRKATTAGQPKRSAPGGTSYLVQVASLRRKADAERLKARLALLGVRAKIQRVTVNGKDYHRVRAGPYHGRREVNKTRALLRRNGLEAIAIRLK